MTSKRVDCENSQHSVTSPLVSLQNKVWGTMAKIPYRNHAAREISLNQSDPSCDTSAWNFCACSSDMITSRVVVLRTVSCFLRQVRRETKSPLAYFVFSAKTIDWILFKTMHCVIFILKILSCKHRHILSGSHPSCSWTPKGRFRGKVLEFPEK